MKSFQTFLLAVVFFIIGVGMLAATAVTLIIAIVQIIVAILAAILTLVAAPFLALGLFAKRLGAKTWAPSEFDQPAATEDEWLKDVL